MTPESPATPPGYGDYPALPADGYGLYPVAGTPGSVGQAAESDYWQQPSLGHDPGPPAHGDGLAHPGDPRNSDAQAAAHYGNGYPQHDQAGYLPNGYPAGPSDHGGYALPDPYGRDGYGGYPEYGASGR